MFHRVFCKSVSNIVILSGGSATQWVPGKICFEFKVIDPSLRKASVQGDNTPLLDTALFAAPPADGSEDNPLAATS